MGGLHIRVRTDHENRGRHAIFDAGGTAPAVTGSKIHAQTIGRDRSTLAPAVLRELYSACDFRGGGPILHTHQRIDAPKTMEAARTDHENRGRHAIFDAGGTTPAITG
jgi:hypothetical protein